MLPFLINLIFLLLVFGIIYSGLRKGFKGILPLKSFSGNFFILLTGVIFLIIGFRVYKIIENDDLRMERLRSEADYYRVIIHKRAEQGRILDRNGAVLAYDTLGQDGRMQRVYPLGEASAHLIGKCFIRGGSITGLFGFGLEKHLYREISGIRGGSSWRGGFNPKGKDVFLTIDADLQKTAFEAMRGRRGAVVVMNPENGEILALVSSPSYDLHLIYEDGGDEYLKAIDEQALFNRALNGLYPPGSTFKLVLATAALQSGLDDFKILSTKEGYKGPGMRRTIKEHDEKAYGKVGLSKALIVSSNQYFAALGLEVLGHERILNAAEDFGFNKSIPWNSDCQLMPIARSSFPEKKVKLRPDEIAQASFGQFTVVATPLQMCMIVAAIGNGGIMMKPQIELDRPKKKLGRVMNYDTSRRLRQMMLQVVEDEEGTGGYVRVKGLEIGGKTGTAEVKGKLEHAWFVCLAPIDDAKIAIAVIVENAGYGGTVATPIAKKILLTAQKKGYFE